MTSERTRTSQAAPSSAPLFPDGPTPRRRRRSRLLVAVVVVALAAAAWAGIAGAERPVALRTATAGVHDVAATLHGVATLEPVVQAAVAFPADGTVAAVDVAVGDEVAVGDPLASLDPDELTESLHVADAELADAELDLRRALDGEDVSSDTGVGGGGTMTPSAATSSSTTDTSTGTVDGTAGAEAVWALSTDERTVALVADAELDALQQAVLAAQQAVDIALAASETALASADEVCGTANAVEDAATSTTTTVADGGSDTQACRTALGAVLTAQQETAVAQQQLAAAAAALDEHLMSVGTGDGADAGIGSAAGSGGPSADSTTVPSDTSVDSSPSSAELIALQQRVDAAALGVAVAEQALARAMIVAPVAGTVVAVDLEVGDLVTAGSSTQTITIQGDDGMEAVVTVALSQVSDVEVGQLATVTPDGSDVQLEGEVVAVSPVPDEDSSSTSYRVTIGFDQGADQVGNGTTGSVAIVIDDVRAALAVPTSAITWTDGVELVTVEVGVVGPEWTEIRSGLDDGDVVVLADPSEGLPGTATDSQGSTATSSGGPAGGGFPEGFEPPSGGFSGGGFSGGGPPSGS
jgi:multidrug efflux pump subunit AcrA (membrane-fusion protein)